tara:strand:+ start:48 stop:182 length:135 start_codon:yes stop_codon:yes gene_type:complete
MIKVIAEIGAGNGYMSIYIAKNREIDQVYVVSFKKREYFKFNSK